ncbi:MAG: hypothetical protein M3179_09980 [Actinomycetota bacterium]|nr:hypothetical protein [Actinomycetota bacterium]
MRPRFVLRYRGDDPPDADLARIEQVPGLTLVERAGKMLLVEADGGELGELMASLDGWVMAPEQGIIEVPDTRKRVRRPPD